MTADFSGVTLTEAGPDRVLVRGGAAAARPGRLKASVGCRDGFIGEGQISYAGPDAVARGRLALEVVARRLELAGVAADGDPLRPDRARRHPGPARPAPSAPPRCACGWRPGRRRLRDAVRIGNEVEALYTNGPAAGGGVTKSAREVIAMVSALVPRDLARPVVHYEAHLT